MPQVYLPSPLPHQLPILHAADRFKVLPCGRRWGKTALAQIALTEGHGPVLPSGRSTFRGLLDGAEILWLAPTYPEIVASGIWRRLKTSLEEICTYKNESDRRIEVATRGAITVASTDNPDSRRGGGYDGVIFDEAASHSEEVWTEVIRPSLAELAGWALFAGTPKGLDNWFYDLYQKAAARAAWARWQRPTADNPLIPASEIEAMREDMGPLEFSQEVLAEFISASAGMFKEAWFRRYTRTAEGDEPVFILAHEDEPNPLRIARSDFAVRFGTVDLAASKKETADYFCAASWGLTGEAVPRLVLLEKKRARLAGGPAKRAELWRQQRAWDLHAWWVESAGFQLDFVTDAADEGLPVRELHADRDKVARALPATSWLERGRVWTPRGDRELEAEILSFPEGANDDQVDVLAYAVRVARESWGAGGYVRTEGRSDVLPWPTIQNDPWRRS